MTTILVCADAIVPADLAVGDARVVVVDELCLRLGDVDRLVPADEDHLVFGVHRGDIDLGSIQAAATRLGVEPLAVGLLDLGEVGAAVDLPVALAAAAARSARFPRAALDQVRLLPPDRSSRRALLSFGRPRRITVPSLDTSGCRAAGGCRSCVGRCPTAALSSAGRSVELDVDRCVSCGLCVTSCPVGAIEDPSVAPSAVEAGIRAALARSAAAVGVRYRCRAGRAIAEPGWLVVEVPCTGMLTLGWLLAPLVMGAGAVDAVPCSAGGCRLRNDRTTEATLADLSEFVDRIGLVRSGRVGPEYGWLLAAGATNRIVDAYAPAGGATAVDLGAADLGTVVIDAEACTVCGACARACPTAALEVAGTPDGVEISFDPRACTACGSCVAACPELARPRSPSGTPGDSAAAQVERVPILVRRRCDPADRTAGRRAVRRDRAVACQRCGRPIAPAALLERLDALLGHGDRPPPAIPHRCPRCRLP